MSIKSGGNTIHGSVYYYNRNEFYAAASPFFRPSSIISKPPRLRNENYGFTVGGPILKNKTFYFAAFEKQEYIIGLSGVATEPSTAWVQSALNLLTARNVPVSSISQNMLGALFPGSTSTTPGLWPSSITGLPATTSNFFSSSPSTGYSYNGIAKLDHNFNDKHHLSFHYFVGQGSQTAPLGTSTPLAVASSNLPYYFERAPIHVQNYSLVLNSTFTPRMTNQILFGVNYFNQTFRDANASFDTKAMGLFQSPDALIQGKPILGAPNIAIIPPAGGGFEQVGITPPEGRNDITGHLTDIVSYATGKHQFRFRGEVRQGRVDEFYFRHSLGTYVFDGTQGPWAGSCAANDQVCLNTLALADFLAGDVSSANLTVGNAERKVTVNAFDFFGGDQWQLTRKLNINLGLRYEYFGPLHNGSKDLAVFIPGRRGHPGKWYRFHIPTGSQQLRPAIWLRLSTDGQERSGGARRYRSLLRSNQYEPVPRLSSAQQCRRWTGGQSGGSVPGVRLQCQRIHLATRHVYLSRCHNLRKRQPGHRA